MTGKSKINIEFQNNFNYNIIKRSEIYASEIFYDSISVGDDYLNAQKTVSIWLLDFELFEDGPYHEKSKTIRCSNNKELSDDITYHYIQFQPIFFYWQYLP